MSPHTESRTAPANREPREPRTGERLATAAPGPGFQDDSINILIVDDEPKNLTVLETVLDDPCYRLVRASSAEQALLALIANEFAVLILDIRMPGMTGFELAQMIKARKKTARVPIIFLTAYFNEDQHVLEGYGSGAVDYLHKPVNPAILRSKVAVFAELHRKNRECGLANRALLVEVTERARAQEQLRELNETLERRVAERTDALVRANAALHETTAAAEKAGLAKSEFLSRMSHELRTPLNAILGFAQLMESGAPTPAPFEQENVAQIVKAGWTLLGLIDEILDLALIESGKLPLSIEPHSLTEIMRQCQLMMAPLAQRRGISVTFRPLETPCFVNADPKRVKQVLVNLLSNAIKYNKPGGSLVVDCVASTSQRVRLSVTDTGEGLTPDQLARLFEPFNRLGQEANAERGAGIGLTVCKRLIELMGGVIGVESKVGQGSVFWIELNLAAGPPAE